MESKPAFKHANRAQTSFLAPVEKKVLLWLARHMPARVNSDHLTALGFLSIAAAGVSYWYSRFHRVGLIWVMVFLVLNWFGDSLDGTLARVRNRQRPRYGFYIDHILDACGTFLLLGGMALSGFMSERIGLGLLLVYLLLSIEVYLATYTMGTFQMSFWKFSPTELRVLLIIGNVALFYRPVVTIAGHKFFLFDVGALCGMLGMTAMLVVAIVRHTLQLYREETLPE